ncbi:hypothetical protein HNR46_002222 [Haloferula luteola]|uniref:F5/8 type C domain-containing protein n=1 Tax=Haloferula luteola TaxID=595692 RepID=A0A840VGS4_9BACT|nr:hypothetical protein [Haloferula luteola]MBB5351981.1 hypothetical protein [Haloferula luteola]
MKLWTRCRIVSIAGLLFLGLFSSAVSAITVEYQYYRFKPMKLRSSTAEVQLSEFQFYHDGVLVTGATVTDEGGSTPDNEGPEKAFDGSVDTKWLNRTFSAAGLIFNFGSPTAIDHYNYITGNDFTSRDPISWTLEGSEDGLDWVPLHAVLDYPVTTSRKVAASESDFELPEEVTPVVAVFELFDLLQPPFFENGTSLELYYEVLFAQEVTLTDDAGSPPIEFLDPESDIPVVHPPDNRITTYTLTAISGGVSTQASFQVRTSARTPQSYRYVRFVPIQVRDGGSIVQLSEFQFLSEGLKVMVESATNPGGSNPDNDDEGAASLVDDDETTKWYSANQSPVIFDFGAIKTFDGYDFSTANDYTGRDPVRWALEGSVDGEVWTLIENAAEMDFPVTTSRSVPIGEIPVAGVESRPVVVLETLTPFIVEGESLWISYSTIGATRISMSSVGELAESAGSIQVSPLETTSYQLTATGPTGVVGTAELEVEVFHPSGVIDYPDFAESSEMSLVGAGQILNDFGVFQQSPDAMRLRLTGLVTNQTGSAWSMSKVPLANGFETIFDAQLAFPVYVNGADGLAFTIQNQDEKFVAAPSLGLLFPDKSVSIVLDSYDDVDGETQANLEVFVGSTQVAIYNLDRDGLNLAKGYKGIYLVTQPTDDPYRMRILYEPGALSIYVDEVLVADRLPIDLTAAGAVDEQGRGFVGFSAKTRHIVAYHDVVNWVLTPSESTPSSELAILGQTFDLGAVPPLATLVVSTVEGVRYQVMESLDLQEWIPAGEPFTATGAVSTVEVGIGVSDRLFLRVEEVE